MSASSENSAIFMTDTSQQIETKINKYAFSGGKATLEEHKEKGADLSIDVPYQYLRFFLHDDAELERVASEYGSGKMMTGEVKKLCIQVLQEFVSAFQTRRAAVTDETVRQFMDFSKSRY